MNEQYTYLGYVLLEAPREYVLHGPLLSTNWLRLCPHLGGPRPKPRRPEEVVYSPNDSCSHFSQRLFPLKVSQQHTKIFLAVQAISLTPIIHHIYMHIYIFYFIRLVHMFTSSDLHGRLAALGSLCPIQFCRVARVNNIMQGIAG
jgi:hypothetical protein